MPTTDCAHVSARRRSSCRHSAPGNGWNHSSSGLTSTARTSNPSSRSCCARAPPMNPPAPATRMRLSAIAESGTLQGSGRFALCPAPAPTMAGVKRALITGITGQDGSFLAEQLLDKGYEVHGIVRRSSSFNTERLDPIYKDRHDQDVRMFLHYGDLSDSSRLVRLLYELQPDEIYHLGAQSHVRVSFDVPEYTSDVTGMGTVRLLEAMRDAGVKARFYQASSSEMFGSTPPPQNEQTPFHPRSPYAVAKLAAYWITVNYRESYGLFAVNGILFNHESARRGETFVTRKITRALARIQ